MNYKFTYLAINLLVIAGPLVLTLAPTVKYYKKLPSVFCSIIIVSSVFISWDIFATANHHWGFNERFIIGFTIFSLPIEEILFFITTPYSCIFIFECIEYYLKDKIIITRKVHFLLFLIFTAASFFLRTKPYTCVVLAFCALFFILARFLFKQIIGSRNYWLYIGISFLPFLAINYILTSLPVVLYNPLAICGLHVFTIPLEDFFYSYSMLSFYLLCYIIIRNFFNNKSNRFKNL
jgi:lycopene cyclase domain-containing protein